MAADAIRGSERIGLGVAIAAHIGLVALLVWRPPSAPTIPPPERMTVTFSDNVGLTSTSPEPMANAAPDMAPTIGEAPKLEPVAEPEPMPVVAPQPREIAPPLPKPVARPQPAPPKPVAKPVAKAEPALPKPKQAAAARPQQQQAAATQRPNTKAPAGGSRFSDAFKEGVPGTTQTGTSRNSAAQAAGAQTRASLAGAVMRKIRPNWQGRVPQGVNAEKLVTILSIELKPDGSLASRPTFVGQEGVDDSNRPQAQRHIEEAIRAVELSAPFDLPPELYSSWKKLPPLRFRRSAQ